MEKIKRLYAMPDEVMQTRAQTMHDILNQDLLLFTAKFPWLDAAWVNVFQQQITAAKNTLPDYSPKLGIRVTTDDKKNALKSGMNALHIIDVYAQLAYDENPALQNVFGQPQWEAARADADKMISALTLANEFADKNPYKTDLMNKGLSQQNIDDLLTIAADIEQKIKTHKTKKQDRPVSTEERIVINNTVFKTMKTVNICSGLVHKNSPAKLKQYHLYKKKEEVPDEFTEATREE